MEYMNILFKISHLLKHAESFPSTLSPSPHRQHVPPDPHRHPQTLTSLITFLLRQAGVSGRDLRHIIHRPPRLLVSDVATLLRPTFYFLLMLRITETSRHCYLLSCSVEEKLIPRIKFLENAGFSITEAKSMLRRFPQLFCYGIEGNLEVKLGFLVGEMGRELREVKEFPQYFSYSLEKRIKRRHLICEERGVRFMLPAMLMPSDEEFGERVEVSAGSTPPVRNSLLCLTTLVALEFGALLVSSQKLMQTLISACLLN